MSKKIGVFGSNGYVGKAMVNFFKDHYDVIPIDKNTVLRDDESREWNLAVVCVPTPMKDDGHCDTSIVEAVIGRIESPLIWIRSTIPPGTTERLIESTDKHIVFSPEYIGEGSYWQPYKFNQDEKEAPWFIFGGHPEDTQVINDFIAPIAGPTKRYIHMNSRNAELVKYMENVYFATKVIFANEMRKICDALGGDYWTVRDGWAADPRVDPMHTAVFMDNPGFSGKCLPKDLNALITASEDAGYVPEFLKEVRRSNERLR